MFADFTIPKHNEAEFVEIAIKLGIKKMYFLYNFEDYNEERIHEKLKSIDNKKIAIELALIANLKNLNKAHKQAKLMIAKSSDDDRMMMEGKKIKMIYGLEESKRKDYLHQRASGLNHIMCELAKRNNIAIGFSYSSLLNKVNSHALTLGRIRQNIKLCQKYKLKTAIGSFTEKPLEMRSPCDIQSLFNILGMDSRNVKESLSYY